MADDAMVETLALIPSGMQAFMGHLAEAAPGNLWRYNTVDELVHDSTERVCSVALIPATGLTPQEWWTVWGFLSTMEPRPSILVYALHSDFEMWTAVLDSGGFDVLVAPFTFDKLSQAIQSASAEFARRANL